MWVVIHMVKSLALAEDLCSKLRAEGFLIRHNAVYRGVSEEDNYFEIKAPEAEAAEARQVLVDSGLC